MKYVRRFSTRSERELFDALAKELSIQTLDDWYKFKYIGEELAQRNGFSFLKIKYGGNLARAISQIYPEHEWRLWKFKSNIPAEFWENPLNRQMFCDDFAKQFGITNFTDWYRVDTLSISKHGGSGLLRKFNNSLFELLKDVYPTHDWKAWDFPYVPEGFWADTNNQIQYFQHLAQKLRIKDWTDWYNVTYDDIWKNRGAGLINWHYNGSLLKALSKLFPEYSWDLHGPVSKQKTQTRIFEFTKEFFPNVSDIHVNYWLQFKHRKSDKKLELDVFIPSLHLAIEYQGRQHYLTEKNDVFGDAETLEKQIERDKEKLELCSTEGISLVVVPFWWNGNKESLGASIAHVRPDLAQKYDLGKGKRIPDQRPSFTYNSTIK